VEYEERYATGTPEGVRIELLLAGAGSRAIALLVDLAIIYSASFALSLIAGVVSPGGGVLIAVLIIAAFLLTYGYFVAFEVLGDGRTVGKRVVGLRVVNMQGGAVGLRRSLIRNLLRLVDQLPGAYIVGLVAIVASRHNQRLGDLAAGTLVVRYRPEGLSPAYRSAQPDWTGHTAWPGQPASTSAWSGQPGAHATYGWDVSAVTIDELAIVRQFLWRANQLPPPARASIAADLASRMRPKVAGAPAEGDPEWFLYQLSVEKLSRG
jgi:uncharacterized RDD family membrane protein YckC